VLSFPHTYSKLLTFPLLFILILISCSLQTPFVGLVEHQKHPLYVSLLFFLSVYVYKVMALRFHFLQAFQFALDFYLFAFYNLPLFMFTF